MTQALEGVASDTRIDPSVDAPTSRRILAEAPRSAQIIALPELPLPDEAPTQERAAAPLVKDWNPLHQVKATLEARVGEVSVTVGELLTATEHHVLRLDRAVDQPIDLTIEGKVVARGQLVAVDGHFAVRITELPMALTLETRS